MQNLILCLNNVPGGGGLYRRYGTKAEKSFTSVTDGNEQLASTSGHFVSGERALSSEAGEVQEPVWATKWR
jgi:hypothetical protein